MEGKTLCWICERPIKNDTFGPFVKTTSGDASACEKHATHKYVADGLDEEKNPKIKVITL